MHPQLVCPKFCLSVWPLADRRDARGGRLVAFVRFYLSRVWCAFPSSALVPGAVYAVYAVRLPQLQTSFQAFQAVSFPQLHTSDRPLFKLFKQSSPRDSQFLRGERKSVCRDD